MKIRNLVTVSEDLTYVLRRFPLAVLMVALLTVGLLFVIHANMDDADDIVRLMGGPILAGYLSVIISLIGEGRGRRVPWLIHIGVVIVALLAAWFHEALRLNVWMAIGAAVLYLGSAPFFKKPQDNDRAWDFTHRIWVGAVFATAGSILFALGLVFINESVRALFDFRMNDLLFEWLMPIALAGLAPIYWLSTIDDTKSLSSEDSLRHPGFISRAIAFMGVWLLAPLVLVFSLILLAYLVQIGIRGELPEGETAGLVTPFLIVGTLTWLILDPAFIREKRIAKLFRAVWFWAMIPAAILLAIAVYIRISEFGLTQSRYLLALAVIWALLTAGWYIFRKKERRDLRVIPSLAAVLLAVGSIGPMGAQGLSAMNQKARVSSVIESADLMTDQGVFKAREDLPKLDALQKRKLGGLVYLYQNGDKDWVRSRFTLNDPVFTTRYNSGSKQTVGENSELSNWQIKSNIEDRFDLNNNRRAEYVEIEPSVAPTDLLGYSQFASKISIYGSMRDRKIEGTLYTLSSSDQGFVVKNDGQIIGQLDMAAFLKARPGEDAISVLPSQIVPFDMEEGAGVEIGFVFTRLSYRSFDDKSDNTNRGEYTGEILVFIKP